MKGILAIAVVAMTFGLTSCKKDWTCTCTSSGSSSSITIPDAKKGDAEDACEALEFSAFGTSQTCELD